RRGEAPGGGGGHRLGQRPRLPGGPEPERRGGLRNARSRPEGSRRSGAGAGRPALLARRRVTALPGTGPDVAVLERLVGFGRYLRRSGLNVGTGRILSFCRAATVLDPFDPGDLRLAARATLVSRAEDFAELTEEERKLAVRLIRRLATVVPVRRSRRYRVSPSGDRFDLRGTLRRSFRTEGEPFDRAWKELKVRQRPLVLILDVSG